MNVVDASVIVELLTGDRVAGVLATAVGTRGDRFAAPHLLDAEVGQVLRRYEAAGLMSEDAARDALDELRMFPVVRFEHGPLLPRALDLRHTVTVYDGLYVALAEGLGGQLLTLDARLARAPGIPRCVELLEVSAT